MRLILLILASFLPLQANYAHYRAITTQHTQIPSNQTNYTLLFTGIYSWLADVGHGGDIQHSTTCCANTETVPADLFFTTDTTCNSTTLNWDIPFWNNTTGAIEVWVGLINPSSTVGVTILACTGNASVTTFQATYTSAWHSSYIAVYHFGDGTTLDLHDSTINAKTCTNHGATATTPVLPQGGAANFVHASSQYIDCGNAAYFNLTAGISAEAVWTVPNLPGVGVFYFALSNENGANGYRQWIHDNSGFTADCVYDSAYNASVELNSIAGGNSCGGPSLNTAHYVILRYDGGGSNNFNTVFDNVFESGSVTANAIGSSAVNFTIGAQGSVTNYFNGAIDEVRISNISRGNDWYTMQYNNMTSPSTFYTVGAPQTPAPIVPIKHFSRVI